MDLFNNALGRTIGSRSYSGNSSQVSYAIRQAVLKAVKDGKIKEKQIDESVKRILILKLNRKIIK